MIFIQVKKTKLGSYISNKKLHVFWNKQKGGPYTTKVSGQNILNL